MKHYPPLGLTPEEYLAIERRAEVKSEYLDGEMFAMSGGSYLAWRTSSSRTSLGSAHEPHERRAPRSF